MILMRAISITRAIGRGGPWKSGLFGALKWLNKNKNVPARVGLHVQQLINDVRLLFPLTNQEENGDNAPKKKR